MREGEGWGGRDANAAGRGIAGVVQMAAAATTAAVADAAAAAADVLHDDDDSGRSVRPADARAGPDVLEHATCLGHSEHAGVCR